MAAKNEGSLGNAIQAQIFRQDVRHGPANQTGPMAPVAGSTPYNPWGGGDPRLNTWKAKKAEQDIQESSQYGQIGSMIGGLAGNLIPIPVLGPAIGSLVGGSIGHLIGGAPMDVGDVIGYGATGALGGAAGLGVGALAGNAGAGVGTNVVNQLIGQSAIQGLGDKGINLSYDPQYRYYYNPGKKETMPAYA